MYHHSHKHLGFMGLGFALCTIVLGCAQKDRRFESLSIKDPEPVVKSCSSAADCNDDNACTIDACDTATHQCNETLLDGVSTPQAEQSECLKHACQMGIDKAIPTGPGVPITDQIAGDCQMIVCDGKGGTKVVENEFDVKIDGLECTNDICSGGMPLNVNQPEGTTCGANLKCNNGQCVGCTSDADCSGGSTACTDSVCVNNSCQSQPKPNGTPLDLGIQTPGDCKVWVCDGFGGSKEIADATDPRDDGNACTDDKCYGTVPAQVPKPAGTSCNGNLVCNGAGSCGGGLGDSCTTNATCVSGFCVDGVCCDVACTANCKSCNAAGSVGTCSNTPLFEMDDMCSGPNVCDGNGACKLANGETCQNNGALCASGNCINGDCK